MKATAFIILIFLLGSSAIAQTITKAKLRGKWKPIAFDDHGRRYAIDDMPHLLTILRTLSPQTAAKGDTAQMRKSAKLLSELYRGMVFDFRNDSILHVSAPAVGQDKKMEVEEDDVIYGLSGGTLIMDADSQKPDKIALTMPDERTMIFRDFAAAGGNGLVFKKQ